MVSRAGREYDDWKLVNQDAHLVLPLPSPAALAAAADSDGEAALRGPASSLLLGAFDGHGHMGTAASRYTRQFIATGVLNSRWHQLDDPGASLDGSSASLDSGAGSSAEGGFGGSSPQPAPGTAEGAQQALASAFEYAGRAECQRDI